MSISAINYLNQKEEALLDKADELAQTQKDLLQKIRKMERRVQQLETDNNALEKNLRRLKNKKLEKITCYTD